MMKTTKNRKYLFAMIAMGIGVIAYGQDSFDNWDKNESNEISRSEFTLNFTDSYVDDWNTDDNDYLDDEDFYDFTYFRVWDENRDELLSVEEWRYGFDIYYGDLVMQPYEDVDKDSDGYISYVEYKAALGKTEFYQKWDMNNDNQLSEFELAKGVFEMYDIDSSNFLEQDEWEAFRNSHDDL